MSSKSFFQLSNLQDPSGRYTLQECIGSGVFGKVHLGIDTKAGEKKVAIKVQPYNKDNAKFIQEEYRVLRDYADHPVLPDFYGIYRKKSEKEEIWFVMEYCEAGPVTNLVLGLQKHNRRMAEDHIAYILSQVIKAVIHLHDKNILHRDIRGSNILLTSNGEVKLVDFGLSREIDGPLGKRTTCIGSPCWMAPEVVTSEHLQSDRTAMGYGSRADVWSIGITAIELADGKPPFINAHPTRAMFQIVRNPPPGLSRPANWSVIFNDFIAECLEKNPEHRPFMIEIIEHPFFENLPENDYYFTQELRQLQIDFGGNDDPVVPEVQIHKRVLKRGQDVEPESMYEEDLAAIEDLSEEAIVTQLRARMSSGQFQTFIGDVLLILNPNEKQDIYSQEYHMKYREKSRSDNAPHIYAVADSAFQDVLHHEEPQHILLSGESLSGKTTSLIQLIEHLSYLGHSPQNKSGEQVLKALAVIHAFSNASTPLNPNSTRCILQTQMTFGSAGKISGAIFWLYQLEKWRVSSTNMLQSNFHIFYYFYDAMEAENKLTQYKLESGRPYRYFRIQNSKLKCSARPRDSPKSNFKQFLIVHQNLMDLGIEESQIDTIWTVLAAILHLGDVQFKDTEDKIAEIDNVEEALIVAELLGLDEKKFCWALTNYCSIQEGTATRKNHTSDEARDARDILSNNLYSRLVDWVINLINYKLSFGRAVFGDKYIINILDSFGFECNHENHLEQLFVNCFNEQMQYHYSQRVFAWEMLEQQEEHIPAPPLSYYDNRPTVDELMAKSYGLLTHIDEASRGSYTPQYLTDTLQKSKKTPHIKVVNRKEIAVAHYTGTIIYAVKELAERNRDFLPPEITDVFRLSKHSDVRKFFTNVLTRTGNLTLDEDKSVMANTTRKARWSAAVVKEAQKLKKVNFDIPGSAFSQTRRMRTAASIFRSTSLEILKTLSVGAGSGGTHFVRCIRADLTNNVRGFQSELVKQQLRALAVLDTARARQKGYPHRIPFNEFLRRYKFLGFDFDETVDVTKDNCRLLLIRLKMEGWAIGRSKIFLTYYNEEYLARLYETQVKKIIKVQSMMRAFLARRNVALKMKKKKIDSKVKSEVQDLTQDEAALRIQTAFRGYAARRAYGPLINKNSGKLDNETADFIRPFAYRWKNKSIFQTILFYRAARFQDIVNLTQQVHIFNQKTMQFLQDTHEGISLDKILSKTTVSEFLGEKRATVWKLPFKFDELPYFDTSYMCDPYTSEGPLITGEDEAWDAPLRWRNTIASQVAQSLNIQDQQITHGNKRNPPLINTPFCRDPSVPVNQIKESYATPTVTKSPLKTAIRPNSPKSYDYNFDTPATKFKLKPVAPEVNPIKELELLGRKNDSSDDEAPYNFQGMLRKTNYKRESLKRASVDFTVPKVVLRDSNSNVTYGEYKNSTPMKICNTFEEEEYVGNVDANENTVVYQSPKGSVSPTRLIGSMELIPGVFIEGLVTDL